MGEGRGALGAIGGRGCRKVGPYARIAPPLFRVKGLIQRLGGHMSVVTILIIVVLVLLALYLLRRVV
jgi:hypothetical protein